ncbi:MAG: Na+/H+ antiporter NhaA [Candidatus Berkiellales bacterium]
MKNYSAMLQSKLTTIICSPSFIGILLIFSAVLALIFANSPLANWYQDLIQSEVYLGISAWKISKPLLLWINDGLMAVFFLVIGLEIKREILEGQLSKISQVILPAFGALGGVIVPAAIYYWFNYHDAAAMTGWAIPTATDIAFALGILSLLGSRVPPSLKIFLMAVAIFDDFAAIVIIAIFYTSELSFLSLTLASIAIVLLIICNVMKVMHKSVYLLIGFLLWTFVLKSGVHATLAGVILAFTIPLKSTNPVSPLNEIEHYLHPWVNYFILPLFAFANAGIHFGDTTLADFTSPLTLGIAFGLFFGKQLGIFIPTFLLVKCKLATMPAQTNWQHIYGVAILSGIGFTMSLFISTLAFEDTINYIVNSRLGIFIGTLLSAIVGYVLLRNAASNNK